MISSLLGGIGLFLLGMTLMAEGLKAAAGGALRDVLARFTGGPVQAFASGAALTALVQSSSATIVATIGFVSAGLIAFGAAIGVIFGAAVGTTSTGLLVAFLGLKYSVSALALPFVGAGAVLRLLGRGRLAPAGTAIAGFGLIFVGIDVLQVGMESFASRFDLAAMPAGGVGGRLLMVLIGIAMTVVLQSSSAAVATTLTALHAGSIGLAQAAALVIGQNVGTTVTAALASLGASIPARRTALAHILLNSLSGLLAFLMLPLYLAGIAALGARTGFGEAEGIALFHTTFTLLGVGILLPLIPRYAAVIRRLLPDRGLRPTRFLDASVRNIPTVAVEVARRTVVEVAAAVLRLSRARLTGSAAAETERVTLGGVELALDETRRFLTGVRSSPELEREHTRHLAVLHAVDHLERLIEALQEGSEAVWMLADPELAELGRNVATELGPTLDWLEEGSKRSLAPDLEPLSRSIAARRRVHRPRVMASTAAGEVDPQTGLRTLDAMRWIDRVTYHTWRTVHHLAGGGGEAAPGRAEAFADPPSESIEEAVSREARD